MYTKKARSIIKAECKRLSVERDAFQAFADEVQQLTVSSQQIKANHGLMIEMNRNQNSLQTVQNCYREIVMTIPYYDIEYGESLHENMAAEFNYNIATTVFDSKRLLLN